MLRRRRAMERFLLLCDFKAFEVLHTLFSAFGACSVDLLVVVIGAALSRLMPRGAGKKRIASVL